MNDLSVTPVSPAERYPFKIPFGWFAVAESDDLAVGATKALYYFDTHLVGWRDESGEAHVQGAFCPHLGAHLGHGGAVEGCEIKCPFHGWKFDGEGTNTDIPYSERTNKRATIQPYPVAERNGFVLAWYHPEGKSPSFDVDEVPELHTGEIQRPQTHQPCGAGRHPGDGRERRRLGPLPVRPQHGRGARAPGI